MEDLPPGLTDVVEDTRGSNESCLVLLIHLEASTESLPACFDASEGALHHHVAPAGTVVGPSAGPSSHAHGPCTVGETHMAKSGNHLLWRKGGGKDMPR